MKEILDIDHLRSLGEPHYFGLGFIQLKINQSERVHFYHPELLPIVGDEEIHNHRYDFESMVILGSIQNKIFTFDPSDVAGTHEMVAVSCAPDASKKPLFLSFAYIRFLAMFETKAGSSYSLTPKAFHQIEAKERTVTYLKRGRLGHEFAYVLRPVGAPAVCPFSKKMEQDEIWQIIGDVINA